MAVPNDISFKIKDKVLEIQTGDITDQYDIDAVVNAANAWLQTGSGVAGAIHRAAGPQLAKACEQFAPINTGEAVITEAFDLPNQFVIHCLGPIYGTDKPEDKLLANCFANALNLADEEDISSVAFPAISTGAFGYPIEDAAEVTLRTILQHLPELTHVNKVRLVLFDHQDFEVFSEKLDELKSGNQHD